MAGAPLTGSLWSLWLYDVCEEIDLEALRGILGVPARREPGFRHPSPEYVRFERPPVVQRLEPIVLQGGSRLDGELNYYEYGVVSIKLELPFEADWPALTDLASRWMTNPELETQALQVVRRCLERAHAALKKPYENWLSEDYYIVHLKDTETVVTAAELISERGNEIARIVRGEQAELSPGEVDEILGSRLSYYPDDLLVVGWTAAFIHDTAEDAAPTIQLLEYANTQLLEFRYYDAVLSQLLQGVYRSLEKKGGFFMRWRLASQAQHLNKIRLDIRELTERVDTSIKFLSDMFSARLYRLAAAKVGVEDYRRLVDGKLHTAGELYEFMMDQFHQSRAFVLEVMVVIILIIELVFLFRGKG
ncbi:MAG TPA: hypothetical protein VNU44_24035 [Bryobacteraceae bacterium]|nr:hypothetical protein [Bryobacteraceae bacterium]